MTDNQLVIALFLLLESVQSVALRLLPRSHKTKPAFSDVMALYGT